MKIRVMSDLHLEHRFFDLVSGEEDVVVLAGDIDEGVSGVEWAAETFPQKPVIFVDGNHHYYRQGCMKATREAIRQSCKNFAIDGLIMPGDKTIIDDVLFVGGILWTDFEVFGRPLQGMMASGRNLNDYFLIDIEDGGKTRTLSPGDTAEMHVDYLNGIKQNLDDHPGMKTVVVTHMAPSLQSSAPRYHKDEITSAFASNLEQFILNHPQIVCWVHGHMHNNSDYMIGTCRVICNPRGYVSAKGTENPHFNENLIIEV